MARWVSEVMKKKMLPGEVLRSAQDRRKRSYYNCERLLPGWSGCVKGSTLFTCARAPSLSPLIDLLVERYSRIFPVPLCSILLRRSPTTRLEESQESLFSWQVVGCFFLSVTMTNSLLHNWTKENDEKKLRWETSFTKAQPL